MRKAVNFTTATVMRSLAVTTLMVVTTVALSTTAYASDDCTKPGDWLDASMAVPAFGSSGPLVGTVKNKSSNCTVQVGIASYQEHDSNIDNQTMWDHKWDNTTFISPGQTLNLSISVPLCAYQIDFFYGAILWSFSPASKSKSTT